MNMGLRAGSVAACLAASLVLVTGGIIAVAPTSPAAAAPSTLYVSTTGTNTSNNCMTSSNPCATVSHAVSEAASGDTIQVAAGTYQDIVAIASPLTNITIDGAGNASTTIDGLSTSAQIGSVFAIESGASATIENLTIADGEGVLFTSGNVSTTYGNGVFVSLGGAATLSNDTITGSTDTRGNQVVDNGGAVYNAGTVTMTDDTVSNNGGTAGMFDGGGIFTASGTTTTLTGVTLSGNVAADAGGAVYNGGTTTLNDDTFSANLVEFTELGNNTGAGVYNDNGTVTLNADTLVNNEAGHGEAVSSNSGTTTTLAGTIVNGEAGLECTIASGSTWNDDGYNLSDDNTCGFTKASSLASTNADLGALGSNGGPTQTFLPNAGSPAIDKIPNPSTAADGFSLCPGTDQRGVARPQGTACDIGSVERQSGAAAYKAAVKASNPLAYWQLNETKGSSSAADSSGNGNTGTYLNNPKLGGSGPFSGAKSVKFSGTNHAEMAFKPAKGSNPVTGSFSVEAWVQASGNALDEARTIVSSRTPNGEYSFDLSLAPGQLHVDVGNGSLWLTNSYVKYAWSIGSWYDLVVTVNGGTLTYYVDGNQVGTATYSGSPLFMDHKHVFQIGDSTRYTTGEFDGNIAQVSIYNQALTPAQVAAHWSAAG
jgi:Concanavalin A-like lectin/glucanases superfamily